MVDMTLFLMVDLTLLLMVDLTLLLMVDLLSVSGNNRWSVVGTGGAVVAGRYGHTAVLDPATRLIWVHGGLVSATATSNVVDHLLAYNHGTKKW